MADTPPSNERIAQLLERVAALLELQKESRYRVQSYRKAARAIRETEEPVADLVEQHGEEALRGVAGIGEKLAGAIVEIVETGGMTLLDRLEDAASAETPFVRVPGLNEGEAARIHDALAIETLEDLEIAAHDGRLAQVEGMTQERVEEIRDALGEMLSRAARRRARERGERAARRGSMADAPPVELLLGLDEEYRAKAQAGELRTIAPRRFNPEGEAWLPILKAEREGWGFTVLFSNTARAHELGKTRDWVVIYYRRGGREDQCTVVTAARWPLRGRRVVRGREAECREYHGV